jgi:hypothetical protein
MDIWITKCRKRAKCNYCPDYIENGEYMVVGKLWLNSEGKPMKWSVKLHWHPKCWIAQAIEKLEKNPKPETRGRSKPTLPPDQLAARVKILRRRAAVVQRIKVEMARGKDTDFNKIVHLGDLLNNLKDEIKPIGGAPKSWV